MRDIALALFIFGTIPFIFARPYIGLLVWSWIGYMNPHRLTYGFAYSFPWVMLIAVITLTALFASKESKKIPFSVTSLLLFLFLAWTAITSAFAVLPDDAWAKWEEFAKVMIMVFATLMLVKDRQRVHWLIWVTALSIGFYGFKGGLFTILRGGAYHVLGPSGSFISDNNALAMALCMVIPLMRYLQLHTPQKLIHMALGVLMILTGIAVLGTYSRGGLIGIVVVSGALLLKSRRRFALILALGLVGATAYHFMPPQWTERMGTLQDARQTDSGTTRIQSWEFAANVAIHRPFVAGGFDDYQSAALWSAYAPPGAIQRAVHSIYFRTLGEQGFVGLALFLGLLATSWWNCRRVKRRSRGDPELQWASDLASMLQITLLAFMSSGAFLPMPYFDLSFQLFAVTAALALCTAKEATMGVTFTESAPAPGNAYAAGPTRRRDAASW